MMDERLTTLAACFGLLVGARWCYGLLSNIRFYFFRSGQIGRYLEPPSDASLRDTGESWALITGSGSGIGRSLAFELAGRGFNIVLHGSNTAKLQKVQEELRAAHPSRAVRMLVFDARQCALLDRTELGARLDEVAKSLEDIPLRILINNVGMPQGRPEIRTAFDAIQTFTYDDLLQNASGNAIFPLLLTRAVYPQLVRLQPALIVNLGSIAALGFPLFPSYGPAKAFTMESAAELRLESLVEGYDIEVLSVNLMSATGTATIKDPVSFMLPHADTFAKAVVRCIGCGYPNVMPYLPHAVFVWVLEAMPLWLRDRFLSKTVTDMRIEALESLKKA
ncbi:NAD(P)-binding protein [Thozetella sp. PMI_491]|nr:NAD(P)-binding protein [Thozetella sp. PMI_491]